MTDAVAIIIAAAERVGVSASLLLSICQVESGLRPAINIRDGGSPSYGMCQVKHETAQMFNRRVTRSELLSSYGSALYGARYLRYQLNRYGGSEPHAISAYNAGTVTKKNFRYVNKVVLARLRWESF